MSPFPAAAPRLLAWALLNAVTIGTTAANASAFDHPAPPPEAATEENEGESTRVAWVDELTVTARSREVALDDAPVAVSVVTGEDWERSRVEKLDNFNGFAPGLMITRNDGAGRVASIRGVGWETAQNLSTQPGVLLYVDGVYVANPLAFGLHLAEVERIEVFRGPQGTEFGQGSTGGAIHLVTRKPAFGERSGAVGLTAGSYERLEASGAVNLPLGDAWAARLSIRKTRHGGFGEIRGGALDGYELDDADSLAGNLSLEWIPSASLSLRVSGLFDDSSQNGASQKHIDDPEPEPRKLTQDYPSTFALENRSASATLDWDTPWGFKLRAIVGSQRLEKRQSVDGDRLTEELVAVDLTGFGPANFDVLPFWDNDSHASSQEIHALDESEKWDWAIGLYRLDHENRNFFLEAVGPAPIDRFADQLAHPSPDTLPPFQAPLEFVEDRTVTREDTAVYGQATRRVGARWAVTLGGRLQRDRSTDEATQFWILDSRQILEADAFTWKVGADLALDSDHLLYALLSTGWKNGGGNPGALNGGALDVPVRFAPEKVTALELGARGAFHRGRWNATTFLYDYEDYQFIQEDPVPFAAGTGNIPQVRVAGLEGEISWRPSSRWRVDGQLSMLDGEIRSDLVTLDVVDFLRSGYGRFTETGVADRSSLRKNLRGNEPPKLADVGARVGLTHERPVMGDAELISRVDYVYRGEYQYRVFNHPDVDRVPSYSTVGLYLGYQPRTRPWEISLTATNLLDEAGVNSRFTNPFGLHTTSEELIPPRQVTLTLRYRF